MNAPAIGKRDRRCLRDLGMNGVRDAARRARNRRWLVQWAWWAVFGVVYSVALTVIFSQVR